ncbi:hypothetical protein H6B11_00560 [Mediterraneibacter glycyrrhizinilyticus]|nr:hypothetical protein [Mediterraneibacter glycyrrhizinilyticus]MBM6852667.1 hypothetical protein [Mediterraneibacter glycyrrhizinilyticus]
MKRIEQKAGRKPGRWQKLQTGSLRGRGRTRAGLLFGENRITGNENKIARQTGSIPGRYLLSGEGGYLFLVP